jgi:hypothetical protein
MSQSIPCSRTVPIPRESRRGLLSRGPEGSPGSAFQTHSAGRDIVQVLLAVLRNGLLALPANCLPSLLSTQDRLC